MTFPLHKIAFVSPHCLIDFTNGAATATREALKLLAGQGFACQAFCGTRLDEPHEGLIHETLARQGIKYMVKKAKIGPYDGQLIFLADGNLPVTLFENGSTRGGWFGAEEVNAFLAACEIFLRKNKPELVVTYGGDEVSLFVQRIAKSLGIPILFFLHNLSYYFRAPFQAVDFIAVPSEFARAYYRQTLGLNCHVLPNIVDPARVLVDGPPHCTHHAPRGERNHAERGEYDVADGTRSVPATLFVTFVNPQTTKGLFVFARIASELAKRRPDIPLSVIEGRSGRGWQRETGIDLAALPNVTIGPNTPDPRTFYAETKLLLLPSLCQESFGLVAAEAMMNGIPVLASNRGALPGTIGQRTHLAPRDVGNGRGAQPHLAERDEYAAGGFLFDIPARYTPETCDVPMAEEVEPWVETIMRLWDDPAVYDRASRAARERAAQWHPDRLAPLYRDFFSQLVPLSRPVLMRRTT